MISVYHSADYIDKIQEQVIVVTKFTFSCSFFLDISLVGLTQHLEVEITFRNTKKKRISRVAWGLRHSQEQLNVYQITRWHDTTLSPCTSHDHILSAEIFLFLFVLFIKRVSWEWNQCQDFLYVSIKICLFSDKISKAANIICNLWAVRIFSQ